MLESAPRISRPVVDSESEECVLPTGTAHENNSRVERSDLVPYSTSRRQSSYGRIIRPILNGCTGFLASTQITS